MPGKDPGTDAWEGCLGRMPGQDVFEAWCLQGLRCAVLSECLLGWGLWLKCEALSFMVGVLWLKCEALSLVVGVLGLDL